MVAVEVAVVVVVVVGPVMVAEIGVHRSVYNYPSCWLGTRTTCRRNQLEIVLHFILPKLLYTVGTNSVNACGRQHGWSACWAFIRRALRRAAPSGVAEGLRGLPGLVCYACMACTACKVGRVCAGGHVHDAALCSGAQGFRCYAAHRARPLGDMDSRWGTLSGLSRKIVGH